MLLYSKCTRFVLWELLIKNKVKQSVLHESVLCRFAHFGVILSFRSWNNLVVRLEVELVQNENLCEYWTKSIYFNHCGVSSEFLIHR